MTWEDCLQKDPTLAMLLETARRARSRAKAPYSNYRVGAAIRILDSPESKQFQDFGGCNVENASYGGTICAERTALVKAASELDEMGPGSIACVLVLTDDPNPAPPCGACRSMIANFDTESTVVYSVNLDCSVVRVFTMGYLLPKAFEREFATTRGVATSKVS